jgi:hypothetical protein
MLFLVSYTLNPNRVNKPLIDELMKSNGWTHHIDNTWIIATNENEKQLYNRLEPFLQQNDLILILEIRKKSSYYGLLPKESWDWISNCFNNGWARE